MANFLLITAVIILLCILASRLSNKLGVPALLLFMVLGMLLGTDGIFKISFGNYELAETICSFTLIFIMFYGGFGTNWKTARPVAVPSFILASTGVFLTAGITGIFCHYVLGFQWIESLLIGSVISSTDAASVFSILRSKNLNLKNGLAPMLEIESGSNDPAAYMLTVIFLGFLSNSTTTSVPILILSQVIFGIAVGGLSALAALFIFRRVALADGLETILTVAIALLAYSLASVIGGNGYLSVYIAGIILGNSSIRHKVTLVHFFDGLTGLMQFVLFFLLGLLATPSQMGHILLPATAIALFLTFIGRPAAIFTLLLPFRFSLKDKLLVSWAGLRGAASIVFAIMVTVSDITMKTDIFHIVFCIAVLSVTFQGTLLPYFANKLGLVDDEESVLKTFNDYIDDSDMELIQMEVTASHPWVGNKLSEIELPPDSLVVIIERDDEAILPKGNTILQEHDTIILSSKIYKKKTDLALWEEPLEAGHPWENQRIMDIGLNKTTLIVMIKRGNNTIIPKGETKLRANDIIVLRC